MTHTEDRKKLKEQRKSQKRQKASLALSRIGNDILSVFMLLVVISIVYSSYVVAFGTENLTPKVMIVPQALYVAIILIKKFTSK